jgi:hypothetical protein
MRKPAVYGVLLATLVLGGCRSTAVPPPPPPPPPPPAPATGCVESKGATATVAVDRDAVADPQCIVIKRGNTTLVWQGGSGVQGVTVTFKPGQSAPDNPECAGATCTLAKAKHAAKHGDFYYDVAVVRTDGTRVVVDPRLIIDP